jgi:peptide/nickel transport system substrate-binding protein
MRSRHVTIAVAATVLSFAPFSSDAQTPKKGGTLTFAVVAEPPNYDCHANVTFGHVHPIIPHYSTLLKIDAQNYPKIAGDLAKSWKAEADGLTYTFKLHPNIKFHDGSTLTSADVKASYERIIKPPAGVISVRMSYYSDIEAIETPDPETVVFKTKGPVAGVFELLASPFNCIYSAAKLQQNPKYPETEILGSGAFSYVESVRGSHWVAKKFDGYFRPGLPYLDGYKAVFVKSPAVVPGLVGNQFDAEFRFRSPPERDQLMEKIKDKVVLHEMPLLAGNTIIFNTRRKPFDDIRVRQALVHAIDRWTGGQQLAKISGARYPGGIMRTGAEMALPESELVKLPGYWKDAEKARQEAKRLLKEAGVENLTFKLLNRAQIESYTVMGVFLIDQFRRIGITVQHEQLETKLYLEGLRNGNFDVGIEFISDYLDDPTQQFIKFLSTKATPLAYSGHTDTKIDELYEKQRRTLDPAARLKLVHELDIYANTQAYSQLLLWSERIVVMPKKIKGWYMTPTHYLSQDLVELWLDQ